MWEILILKWFLPLKIQINSKRPGFGRKKSIRDVVTLGPTTQAPLVPLSDGFLQRGWKEAQNRVTLWITAAKFGPSLGGWGGKPRHPQQEPTTAPIRHLCSDMRFKVPDCIQSEGKFRHIFIVWDGFFLLLFSFLFLGWKNSLKLSPLKLHHL